MSVDDSLVTAIKNLRKVSADGSLVTYDLTSGVDFSNPKKTAEALAKVFFENEARTWFTVSGDHVDFNPTYRVRIVLAEEHNKMLEETVDDFLKDLQKEEISPSYSKQIKDNAERATKLQTVIAVGTIRSMLFGHTEEKVYRESIRDDFFVDLLEKLEIRSLDNKDLMDWKNLPL